MFTSRRAKRLKAFLVTDTNLYDITFKRVAEAKYKEATRHIEISGCENKSNFDAFVMMHHKNIADETNRALLNTCKKILSCNDYGYLFTQIGLFSLFLLPPIYPLIRYSMYIWREPQFNTVEFSFCVGSVLLLLALLFAAAFSVFLSIFSLDKNHDKKD